MMANEIEKTESPEESLPDDLRAGVWIAFLLAVFTIGEFIAALIAPELGWLLLIAALPKAYFVITDYMHIGHLFKGDGESQ
jgi:hypothetical protein